MTEKKIKNPTAYGYLRVSSEQQVARWNWIEWQRWAIEDFANRENIDIVRFFDDKWVSWKFANRPWLNEMLKNLKKENKNPFNPKINYIIVDDIDRIARDVWVRSNKRTEIESTWAYIISPKWWVIENTPESNLSTNITMATKQYERENNSRRVISRQKQRLLDWYRCFCTPIGYKYEKAKHWGWKVVVPDEPTFSIVSQWLKLLASWAIANQQGLCDYFRKKWLTAKKWWNIKKSAVNHMIHPDSLSFYAGFINCPKRWIEMIKWRHEPAITESEFYEITNTHKIKGFYKEYDKDEITEKLPLRSVLCCEYCWRRLTWSSTRWNWWRYFYYYCWSLKCPHSRKAFKCDVVHHDIEELLKRMTLDDTYLCWLKVIFDSLIAERNKDMTRQLSDIKDQISWIDKEIDKLVNKIADSSSATVTKILEGKVEELENEKALLKWEMIKKESWDNDSVAEFEQLKSIIKSPYDVRKMWDIELKKLLINVLFSGTMTYSIEHSTQTKEIPLIYAQRCKFIEDENFDKQKSTQTECTPYGKCLFKCSTWMVGLLGLEPRTDRLWAGCSNQLSYRPIQTM